MDTKNAIGDLVGNFVNEILGIVRRLVDEGLATALKTSARPVPAQMSEVKGSALVAKSSRPPLVGTSQEGTSQKRTAATTPTQPVKKPGPKRKMAGAKRAPGHNGTVKRGVATKNPHGRQRRKPLSTARGKSVALRGVHAKKPPEADRAAVQAEREAKVLEAVRTLVKSKQSEIVKHSRLSKKVVYTTLLTLVERGQLTKTEAPRGAEFSLGTPGGASPAKQAEARASAAGRKRPSRAKRSRRGAQTTNSRESEHPVAARRDASRP